VDNVSVIHDHPWDFRSEIVCGELVNVLYDAVANGPDTHHMQRIVCGPGGHAVGEPESVRLSVHARTRYIAGQEYYETGDWLHESQPTPGTVTLVGRAFLEDTEHARVCFPLGTEWVSAEPRPATGEEVIHFTKLALGRLSEDWGC